MAYKLFLENYYPVFTGVLLALCAILSAFCVFSRGATYIKSNWKFLAGIAGIFTVALAMRLYYAPARHYALFDEYENINFAENIANSGRYGFCVDGNNAECRQMALKAEPAGFPYLLSLWIRVAGDTEDAAFSFSALLGSLSVAAIGFLAYNLFGSAAAGLWCSFLLCFLPVHLKYSKTTVLEISSLLFLILSFSAAAAAMRRREKATLLLAAALSMYLLNTRAENWVFLILIPLFLFTHWKAVSGGTFLSWKDTLFLLPLLVFAVPFVISLYLGINVEELPGWRMDYAENLGYLKRHLTPNILFLAGQYSPWPISALAALGLIMYGRRNSFRIPAYWIFFFAVLLTGYSSYYIGYFNYFENDRFSLHIYMFMILWSGFGVTAALSLVPRSFRSAAAVVAVAVLAVCSIASSQKLFLAKNPLETEVRKIIRGVDSFPADLPVISFNTSPYIVALHRKCVNLSEFSDPARLPDEALFVQLWVWNDDAIYSKKQNFLRSYYDFAPAEIMRDYNISVPIYYLKRKTQ